MINRTLMELGPHYQARFVATNDSHYINPEDAKYQDILLAIQTGALLSDPDRMRMTDGSYYLRSPEEMARLFAEVPESLSNTLLIAERCNVSLDVKNYRLPQFEVPQGRRPKPTCGHLCEEGVKRRYGERADSEQVRTRLDYELGIIHKMGFDAYFLIVWDLCRYARGQGIWYNARGSANGSIVAYTLDITLVDPLQQELLFERFLNPGRISMPDIDLDFPDDRRADVLDYTVNKYGQDKVAQIITFGTLGARAALRDVGRVMDIPLPEVDRVAKIIPNIPSKAIPLRDIIADDFKGLPGVEGRLQVRRPPARADRYRRQNGRGGSQRRDPCRRGGHFRQAPVRVPAAAPSHQQLRRDPHQDRHPVRNGHPRKAQDAQGGFPRPGNPDHHGARLRSLSSSAMVFITPWTIFPPMTRKPTSSWAKATPWVSSSWKDRA